MSSITAHRSLLTALCLVVTLTTTVLLEWATALEMLLAAEGGKKGEAAAMRLQERIESARSAILAA